MSNSNHSRFQHRFSCVASARNYLLLVCCLLMLASHPAVAQRTNSTRERISLNADWRFVKGDPSEAEGRLVYEKIKGWVTATGSEFVSTSGASEPARPAGNLGEDLSYTQ